MAIAIMTETDELCAKLWARIELAHEKVMKTKTLKTFDKAQAEWIKEVIKGAEQLKRR